MELPQEVKLEHNNNTRHFGGYHTCDNRIVKQERIIRSGLPVSFSEKDFMHLTKNYQLHTIIDFRGEKEVVAAPVAATAGISYINLPLIEAQVYEPDRHAANQLSQHSVNSWLQIYKQLGGTAAAVQQDMEHTYISMLTSPYSQKQLQRFFDIILQNDQGSILFHCTGGKDRTGIAAMLFLCAVGVSWDVCVDDYMLTNLFWHSYIEQEIELVKQETSNPDIISGVRRLLSADYLCLERTYDYIQMAYGSVDNYLAQALGYGIEKRQHLKDLYTKKNI